MSAEPQHFWLVNRLIHAVWDLCVVTLQLLGACAHLVPVDWMTPRYAAWGGCREARQLDRPMLLQVCQAGQEEAFGASLWAHLLRAVPFQASSLAWPPTMGSNCR